MAVTGESEFPYGRLCHRVGHVSENLLQGQSDLKPLETPRHTTMPWKGTIGSISYKSTLSPATSYGSCVEGRTRKQNTRHGGRLARNHNRLGLVFSVEFQHG